MSRQDYGQVQEIMKRLQGLVERIRTALLGRTLADKWSILSAQIECRLGRQAPRPRQIQVQVCGRAFRVEISSESDLFCLREIFVMNEYGKVATLRYPLIIDVGANVGFASLFFAARFPHAKILAIEADPVIFRRLLKNTEGVPNIRAFNFAVGAEEGMGTLFVSSNSLGSSVIQRSEHQKTQRIPIQSLKTFVREQAVVKIGLLKFDIEGAEDRMFDGMDETVNVLQYVGELHFDLMDRPYDWFSRRVLPLQTTRKILSANRAIMHAVQCDVAAMEGGGRGATATSAAL